MSSSFEPQKTLGRTGFRATALGIGDLADRAAGVDACVRTLRRALDAGLNVIDTAPSYEDGFSEEVVGRAVRGRREGVFLVDKVDIIEADVAPQVEASLERLGEPDADLFVFHNVLTPGQWKVVARAGGGLDQLAGCVRRGLCRFVGVSSHDPDVLRAALDDGRCDVVMFPVGPFVDRRYEEEILPLARQKNVGALTFKTFGAGKLVADTTGYGRPLDGPGPLGGAPHPRLSVEECVRYTLTIAPDCALLGLSSEREQDEAWAAARAFRRMTDEEIAKTRERAALAVAGKGPCWWNPAL